MVDVPTLRYVHSTGHSTFVQLQHFRFMQFMVEYTVADGVRERERGQEQSKREFWVEIILKYCRQNLPVQKTNDTLCVYVCV